MLENTLNYNMVNTYFDFRDRPTQEERDKTVLDFGHEGILVQYISFQYPYAEEAVIQNVSLAIQPGENLVIIREIGSGKTTLSKLLCGLYAPDSVTVTIGGRRAGYQNDGIPRADVEDECGIPELYLLRRHDAAGQYPHFWAK